MKANKIPLMTLKVSASKIKCISFAIFFNVFFFSFLFSLLSQVLLGRNLLRVIYY